MELKSRTSIALLLSLALLVTTRSEAFPIGGCPDFSAIGNRPSMSLYTGDSNSSDGAAHWDPAANLIYIPGATDRVVGFNDNSGARFSTFGRYSLYLNATPNYESTGGIFTVFGAFPELGIPEPSLLFAANVIDVNIGGSPCTTGVPVMQLTMHVDYFNPNFGNWGTTVSMWGAITRNFPGPDPNDPLKKPFVGAPSDYWDLFSVVDAVGVSEPGPIGLAAMGLGMIAFGFARRRLARR